MDSRVSSDSGRVKNYLNLYLFYHMEHFIDGEYRKFNSNNGFVSEERRRTPAAFSHFSFEHSNRELMVVDIQVSKA